MRPPHTCIFGLLWGDEGKGKVVDLLCPSFDVVVRFNGGANAGHTVQAEGRRFALHLLPSGVLHPHATCIIGPGVVVDPSALVQEMLEVEMQGSALSGRLWISDRAHLVLRYHKIEDELAERSAESGERIGTTARGIGPCYADKMRRTTAARVCDLGNDESLKRRIRRIVEARRRMFSVLYGTDGGLTVDSVLDEILTARKRLQPFVANTAALLGDAVRQGESVLFEGANGMMLDIDHGTYPYVTSSSTGPHGIGSGAGFPPHLVERRLGAVKAYATRVGSGPFVSELKNEIGDRVREQGHEYGTTTGRPRRCGWFDAVACRYAVNLSGATDVALLHMDTLRGIDPISICVGYRLANCTLHAPPSDSESLERCEPILETVPGWTEDLGQVRVFEDLPKNARNYVERIEQLTGARISLIGVGADRTQVIICDPSDTIFSSIQASR